MEDLSTKTVNELKEIAKEMGLKTGKLNKQGIINLITEADKKNKEETASKKKQRTPVQRSKPKKKNTDQKQEKETSAEKIQPSEAEEEKSNIDLKNPKTNTKDDRYAKLKDSVDDSVTMSGIVQILPEGFGFMRPKDMKSPDEAVYVSASQVQKFKLVSGNQISGRVRPPKESEKYYAMLFVEEVNGRLTSDILEEEKQKLSANSSKDMSLYEQSHEGVLEINQEGYGFLRTNNYMTGDNDIYVSPSQIRKYKLKTGDQVKGRIKIASNQDKFDALLYVETVNDLQPEQLINRSEFERLVPIFPDEKIKLETRSNVISNRILDLFSPIGKGQRGLIVSPPKAGKTILLKGIANAIEENYPDIKLIVLLVDERPEEVTDMQRSIKADVVYSTFDQKPSNHIKAAEMVLERAKRLVESRQDVVILVDSITRLARANNLVVAPSGRTLSGGLDPESLYFPKKFFGAARNIESGGSLTIIATALIDTGSRMDDMIYEEFKGTGNMEVHLDRELSESRIFPAINIPRSGTRREDLLLTDDEIKAEYGLRKALSGKGTSSFTDNIIQYMKTTRSNTDFINKVLRTM